MELKDLLNSGLLELYVMGQLAHDDESLVLNMKDVYPEVKKEISALEGFCEQDACRNSVAPSERMNKKMDLMFASLEAEQHIELSNLPLISGFSDANAWLALIAHLLPENDSSKRFEKVLRLNDGVMQVLVVSPTNIEEEVHEELHESFLILKGTCICTIGETSRNMGPGDYMQIPLHLPHKVTLTSGSVTAILQRVDLD